MNAEQSLIGAILLSGQESQIFIESNRDDIIGIDEKQIYDALYSNWEKYGKVDVACLRSGLRPLAVKYAESCLSPSSWKMYIESAKKESIQYRASLIGNMIATGTLELEELSEAANQLLRETQGTDSIRRMNMKEAVEAFWIDQAKEPKYIRTGYSKLDKYVFIEPGDYIVIGARPSQGKTAMGLKLGRNIASQDYRTTFYSYETKVEKMIGRTMAAHCKYSMKDIKNHTIAQDERSEHLSDDLTSLPFEFVEASGKPISWLKADITRTKTQVAIVDYIGQIPSQGNGRTEMVANTSLGIRDICQRTGVCMIVLAQINRTGKEDPTMESLKESGQIEQDADVVILLNDNQELVTRNDGTIDIEGEYEVLIAKNKEGQKGKILMRFDGRYQDFWELETNY